MKRVCKVSPGYSTCSNCLDIQIECQQIRNCRECKSNAPEYELLGTGTGFWSGDYAMVLKDGKIESVSLSRVYDIRDV